MEWITIPGGQFELAGRKVEVATFQLARTEVTNAQYLSCLEAGACTVPHCGWPPAPEAAGTPVVCVDHAQAGAFSKWAGGRLPTEAEWEFAASGRGAARPYPWGPAPASCRYAVMADGGLGCGSGGPLPVCSRPQGDTPQGLCDMAGNVWEWVEDWYAPDSERVLRGGSWFNDAALARSDFRDHDAPGSYEDARGLRPAR